MDCICFLITWSAHVGHYNGPTTSGDNIKDGSDGLIYSERVLNPPLFYNIMVNPEQDNPVFQVGILEKW
jgi:hypothetical protein